MKKIFLKSMLLVACVVTALTSCKKDETEEPVLSTPQLSKVTYWNPSTGAETAGAEFIYDAKGTITTATFGGVTYNATYNSANKLSALSGTVKGGYTVSFALEYNSSGQLVKVVNNNLIGTSDNSSTKTISYNSGGKISKMVTVYTNTAISTSTVDYTWSGDNLATSSVNGYLTTYTTYDDKLSPMSLSDNMAIIYYGLPASKNNPTELKSQNGTNINTQKRGYEYNAAGYAISMKLLDTSNEGQKYYYK